MWCIYRVIYAFKYKVFNVQQIYSIQGGFQKYINAQFLREQIQGESECKVINIQGVFFTGPPPEKLKYGKPRLAEVRCI